MIERKKYGALGWNGSLSYEFNDTDYDICKTQLRVYLDQYEQVPFTVLRLLTAYINYGGRITDDKDMRTAEVIMNGFYKPAVLEEGYSFSTSTWISWSTLCKNSNPLLAYSNICG